jgi:hypothetical protein
MGVALMTPIWLCSDVKMRADCKELLSSRCTASLSHCRSYVRHTSTAILIAGYLTYFDALSSFCKITVPYPGFRIFQEADMKYTYIEVCYFYAGSTCIYIIKRQSSSYQILLLIKMYFEFLYNERYRDTLHYLHAAITHGTLPLQF